MKIMLNLRILTGIKLLAFTILVACAAPVACSQVPINGEVMDGVDEIESEYYSNYPEEGEITKRISSESVFEIEWEMIHEGMQPIPELPEVDFDERDLILVMLSTKPTGGYGIHQINVQENADQIVVQFAELHPGDNCITTQALTRPYKIISIPKSDKEVIFLKGDTVYRDCSE